MAFRSTKTYGHEVGLSCAFRQWRADSHCQLVHGYALGVRLEFEARLLDHRNWVIDFGALKTVKTWLQDEFDHKLVVARDDPHLPLFMEMEKSGVASINVVPDVGCEAFAERIYRFVDQWLLQEKQSGRVKLLSVEVREHGANSAIYTGHP